MFSKQTWIRLISSQTTLQINDKSEAAFFLRLVAINVKLENLTAIFIEDIKYDFKFGLCISIHLDTLMRLEVSDGKILLSE
jgi:hypothetical protein